ncbi:hypothetical protein RRG08_062604 [Elysia crispata]|uniref:Uncharacterized protein n=1 Tax=Elysia crispata TaxID=231223 RepID=A0AAE0YYM8_9GAST|nr:hypothetical protein RRG08_062604 [Elysia crispata]
MALNDLGAHTRSWTDLVSAALIMRQRSISGQWLGQLLQPGTSVCCGWSIVGCSSLLHVHVSSVPFRPKFCIASGTA